MGDCGVCIHADYETADMFEVKEVKCRKDRYCCECGKVIPAKTPHEQIDMLFDGKWWHYHTCDICAEIAGAFMCDGRVPRSLWEGMYDVMDALTTSCFDRLKTPQAKAELQRRWQEWKFES